MSTPKRPRRRSAITLPASGSSAPAVVTAQIRAAAAGKPAAQARPPARSATSAKSASQRLTPSLRREMEPEPVAGETGDPREAAVVRRRIGRERQHPHLGRSAELAEHAEGQLQHRLVLAIDEQERGRLHLGQARARTRSARPARRRARRAGRRAPGQERRRRRVPCATAPNGIRASAGSGAAPSTWPGAARAAPRRSETAPRSGRGLFRSGEERQLDDARRARAGPRGGRRAVQARARGRLGRSTSPGAEPGTATRPRLPSEERIVSPYSSCAGAPLYRRNLHASG